MKSSCIAFIDHIAGEIIHLVASLCVSLHLSVGAILFDLDFWHEGRPLPWLAGIVGQGQRCVVYTFPFEPGRY